MISEALPVWLQVDQAPRASSCDLPFVPAQPAGRLLEIGRGSVLQRFRVDRLLRADRPLLGRLLVVLGAGAWAAAVMTMLDVHSPAVIGAGLLVLLAIWLVRVVMARRRRPRVRRQAT